MKLPIYQLDAFSLNVFGGNPAAVCPLDDWPEDALLQAIAAENNLAETAFFVRGPRAIELRWFTPSIEVDLCGHATLATAALILDHLGPERDAVAFETRSGRLMVQRDGDGFAMDLPADPPVPVEPCQGLVEALGVTPLAILAGRDYLVRVADESSVRRVVPDLGALARIDRRGVIVTAPGQAHDFVSRFFAPGAGVPEDPVTGSAHCALTPYWARELGKRELRAFQLSARGGEVLCTDLGERVRLWGRCAFYLEGRITV
jgi:PhzF family phenazine biosynthesis protein